MCNYKHVYIGYMIQFSIEITYNNKYFSLP